jgi:hypothetical protein
MKTLAVAHTLLVCLLLSGTMPAHAQCSPTTDQPQEFLTRYGIADGVDLAEIFATPTELTSWAEPQIIGGSERLVSEVEYHVVFEIPFFRVVDVMMDVERQEEFVGTVLESRVLCTSATGTRYFRQYMETQFRWSVFSRRYKQIINLYVETPNPTQEYRSRFALDESLDGKMLETRGSWYARRVSVDGVDATYVRAVQQVTLSKNPLPVRIAIQGVVTREMANTLDRIAEEARARMASHDERR